MIGTELLFLAKAFKKLINQYISQNGDKHTYFKQFPFYHNQPLKIAFIFMWQYKNSKTRVQIGPESIRQK